MDNQKVRIFFQIINRPQPTVGRLRPGRIPNAIGRDRKLWENIMSKEMPTTACMKNSQEGWDEPYKVMLKWKGAALERQIRGKTPSRMVFETGKCYSDFFHTPYGALLLETETHRLEFREEQDGVFLMLEYGIKQDGQIVSENRMEIRILGTEKRI